MKVLNILFLFSLLLVVALAEREETKRSPPRHRIIGGYNHMWKANFMYTRSWVFQNIKSALRRGVIKKFGNPRGWHQKPFLWHKRQILRFGLHGNEMGGLRVKPPRGFNVLWLRVLNDRYFYVKVVSQEDKENGDGEIYAAGHRRLNEISPDGAAPDTYWNVHAWVPIPIRHPGKKIYLYSQLDCDCWISGIGFGKNLWGHAKNSALAYHRHVNGGSPLSHFGNWNNDQLGYLWENRVSVLFVPVVPNGRDKLLYIAEHNNNWTGTMHLRVTVNGRRVGRFRTSYSGNPFATHFNNKIYDRYMALFIPRRLIRYGAKFVRVTVDMRKQNHRIHFREIGTHDASWFDNPKRR